MMRNDRIVNAMHKNLLVYRDDDTRLLDAYENLGFAITDDYDLGFPEAKTKYIDIPGRDGPIDLSDALLGPHYGTRIVKLPLAKKYCNREQFFESVSRLRSYLHNRRLKFILAMDENHYYVGRFEIGKAEYTHYSGTVDVTVTCDPWRYRQKEVETFDARGGVTRVFCAGDMPVHPVIECSVTTKVECDGYTTFVPPGDPYLLNDITLGNEPVSMHFCGELLRHATWNDFKGMSWDDARGMTWDSASVPTDVSGEDALPDQVTVTYKIGEL